MKLYMSLFEKKGPVPEPAPEGKNPVVVEFDE